MCIRDRLNVEDTHIVSYALKKLDRLGVVRGERSSKEVFYSVTPQGAAILKRYGEIREQCLTAGLDGPGGGGLEFSRQLAHTLRALSGLYDQAARAATSL